MKTSPSSLRRYLALTAAVAGTTLALGTARADQLPTSDPAAGAAPAPEAAPAAPAPEAQPEQPAQAPQANAEQEPYNEQTMGPRTLDQAQAEQVLNPHGYWVVLPGQGRVWVPNQASVGADFRPYVAGRWALTTHGWTWVSNYSWGWVPFHYGRWVYAPTYGWAWAPGYRWAPAWVSWRVGGGYVGWAPYGYLASWGYRPWVFVGSRYFLSPRLGYYSIGLGYIGGIWGRTAFVRGYRVYGGYGFFSGPRLGVVRGWGSFGFRAASYRAGFRAGVNAGYRGGYRSGAGFRAGVNSGYRAGVRAGAGYRSNIGARTGSYGGARVSGGFRGSVGARGGYTSNRGSYSGRASVSSVRGGGARRR